MIHMNKHIVYGGQFGSEGKGNYVESLIEQLRLEGAGQLVVIGEPSPNSGHTCSKGKLRQLPTGSFWANEVWLGPDSVINMDLLRADFELVKSVNPNLILKVHEHAALLVPADIDNETKSGIVRRVASTASGVGSARNNKFIIRDGLSVIKSLSSAPIFQYVNTHNWLNMINHVMLEVDSVFIFECNQGVMLDPNFGYFPYCTSRSTLPSSALARNGLSLPGMALTPENEWMRHMVIRTYPIRTGGNSGPTGGRELSWDQLNLPLEIATVTKRTRRVFEFSRSDFITAFRLTMPDVIAITHCDYIGAEDPNVVMAWLNDKLGEHMELLEDSGVMFVWSREPGKFNML